MKSDPLLIDRLTGPIVDTQLDIALSSVAELTELWQNVPWRSRVSREAYRGNPTRSYYRAETSTHLN